MLKTQSELFSIKEEAEVRKQALRFVRARYIRIFEEHERRHHGVSKLFSEFFIGTSWSFFKNCAF